jgi:transposase
LLVSEVLDHTALTPDNNNAENTIRPFVLGRKNWLFSGSPSDIAGTCANYSLIETAKQNDLKLFLYLYYVLVWAPRITADTEWDGLLPGNLTAEAISAFCPVP